MITKSPINPLHKRDRAKGTTFCRSKSQLLDQGLGSGCSVSEHLPSTFHHAWHERGWLCGVGKHDQRRSPLAQGLQTQMLIGVECLQVVE